MDRPSLAACISQQSLQSLSRLAGPFAGSRSAVVLFSGRCYVRLFNCTAPGLEVLIRLDEPTLALALGCSKLSLPDCDMGLQSLIPGLGSFISGLVLHGQSYIVK